VRSRVLTYIPLAHVISMSPRCHDLEKQLSHYLYFFSFLLFSFIFFYLELTIQKEVWESIMSQVLHSCGHMTSSVMSYDGSHDKCGKVVHKPYSSCISSIENLMGTPLSSSC